MYKILKKTFHLDIKCFLYYAYFINCSVRTYNAIVFSEFFYIHKYF